MQIKARRCFVPLSPSDWVAKVFLTCDNKIAVQFKHGQHVKKILPHGPGAYLGHGGVPHVCCLYPGTAGDLAETLYELAQVWSYAGEWVHAFLYKKFGYVIVAPPEECGNCNIICSISLNPAAPNDGDTVTITVTVTNTDGGDKGEAPEGTVTISVDGEVICTQTLPENDPDTQNWESVSCTWGASCLPQATHTITATYTPAQPDWASTECSASVTVGNCAVTTACCPGVPLPQTLHATVSDAGGGACLAGTYPLTYSPSGGSAQTWQASIPISCGSGNFQAIIVGCSTSGQWSLAYECGILGGSYWDYITGATSSQCSPLQVVFANVPTGSYCTPSGGAINITVTE